jgi:hypothetical protein
MRAITACGVFAGARRPNHESNAYPGTLSARGGTSGRKAERLCEVTPRRRMRASLRKGIAPTLGTISACERAASTSVVASCVDLNGMCTMSSFARLAKYAIARWPELPWPAEA